MITCKVIISITIILLITTCRDKNSVEPIISDYEYEVPQKMNDDWEVSSAETEGLNIETLTQMVEYLEDSPDHLFHSIILVKNSQLVFEKYYNGYRFNTDKIQTQADLIEFGPDSLHYLGGISKSITSLLCGIAIENSMELSIENKIQNYFQVHSSIFDEQKQNISVENLLTMSAGLDWDELSYDLGDPRSDLNQLFLSDNPVKFILEKPIVAIPGTKFLYNSGLTVLLSNIIEQNISLPLSMFAEEKLFNPLKISKYKLDNINQALPNFSGGYSLSPRNLAKIGQIYVDNGKWKGERIVSESWVEQSTVSYINPNFYNFSNGYGFHWWKNTFQTIVGNFECYFAVGLGEQLLYVFPNHELVIVITAGYYYGNLNISAHDLVSDFILPSIAVNDSTNSN